MRSTDYYFGSSDGLGITTVVTAAGENAGDAFGSAVNSSGDINGDGSPDIIIGAPDYSSSSQLGKIYLHYGDAFIYLPTVVKERAETLLPPTLWPKPISDKRIRVGGYLPFDRSFGFFFETLV